MTTKNIATIVSKASFFLMFFSSRFAFAQNYPNPLEAVGVTTVPGFLALVLQGLSMLLIPLIVIYIIYAGYLFVTAQGEEGKIQKARTALLWSLIGAGVIIGAQIMAEILSDTLTELNTP